MMGTIPPKIVTLLGLAATIWYAFTHPGHDSNVCTALAALWGLTHDTYGVADKSGGSS